MQCAMIIPTLQAGSLLDTCVLSVLNSGYDGDVYVVSHSNRCSSVEKLGGNVVFVNTDTLEAEPTDTLIHKGFLSFNKKYDLMIYSHNDTVYYAGWWSKLQELWQSVDTRKVGSISIPASYDINHIVVTEPNQKLGFGFDIYNPKYRARFSPCTSFLSSLYEDTITKYGWNTYFSMELFLLYEAIIQHKWSMMANNGCYVDHKGNGDVGLSKYFGNYFAKTYEVWFNHFGYNLEHFIAVWFGCVLNVHSDEILNSINSNNYDSIDYIFDGALKSINNTDCSGCGIEGCHARGKVRTAYR